MFGGWYTGEIIGMAIPGDRLCIVKADGKDGGRAIGPGWCVAAFCALNWDCDEGGEEEESDGGVVVQEEELVVLVLLSEGLESEDELDDVRCEGMCTELSRSASGSTSCGLEDWDRSEEICGR